MWTVLKTLAIAAVLAFSVGTVSVSVKELADIGMGKVASVLEQPFKR